MARIAGKTRVVMKEFLARATERKIDRLSGPDHRVVSFPVCASRRWSSGSTSIPSTFAITLYSEAGPRTFQGAALRGREADLRDLGALGVGPRVGPSAAGDHRYADGPARRRPPAPPGRALFPAREPPGVDSFDRYGGRSRIITRPSSRTSRGLITSITMSRRGRRGAKKATSGMWGQIHSEQKQTKGTKNS